ncbi:MAG: class I SAM-dependent methyltransferase [Ferruginibacter sp.]
MNTETSIQNEKDAASAFSAQAPVFDELYGNDGIVRYKRERVHDHVLGHLKQHAHILELNSGTGEDAIFFAKTGHTIHATDISEGMQAQLKNKVAAAGLSSTISCELCSFTQLNALKDKGPYDLIFSNFAGLNCSNELPSILDSFDKLLKPGGMITLVILPKFCLWELLLIFKGKFKTATRRFFSSKGRKAKVNGVPFICWYHSPKPIIRQLKEKYSLLGLEGLCTIVPPSYIENFSEKYPRLFSFLVKKENKLKAKWPWKYIGDYYIISFRKK